jgi:hypothetical protein
MTKRSSVVFVLAMIVSICFSSFAGEQGHYTPGSWGCRDLTAPPPGTVIVAPYLAGYHANIARDGKGHVIDGSDGIAVSANSWMFQLALGYAPELDVLGADWGMMILPGYGEAGASARFTKDKGGHVLFDNNGQGLSDLYVIPTTLTWHINSYWDISAQYGFWAPIGKYDSRRADNVGLGYWSHDFRGTLSYYPLGNPGLLLFASALHEINSDKEGFDLVPAPHSSLEMGASMAFSEKIICGLMTYGVWETGETRGTDASEDGYDRMYGVAAETAYWFYPGTFGCTVRLAKEFMVRDRFEGWTLVGGLNFLF